MKLFAVIGNPIAHSLSPLIHEEFANQNGLNLTYQKILATSDNFEATVKAFQKRGGNGLNITKPFKEQAYQLCHLLSGRAKKAGAVNTIKFLESGEIYGDNTDGIGFIRDIKVNLNISLAAKKILILGAGGAARGILPFILAEDPLMITVANRDLLKAHQLQKKQDIADKIIITDYFNLSGKFEIIINCTNMTLEEMKKNLSAINFYSHTYCYDLTYHPQDQTPFLIWAANQKLSASDGIGMLAEQAAESFWVWYGIRPSTEKLIKNLKK